MRRAAAVLIGLLTTIPIYFWCLVPWQCNLVTQRMESALNAAIDGSPAARAFLRENIGTAEACRQWVPGNQNLNVALAAAYSMHGQPDAALRVYDDALRFDRRPEMFYNRAGIRLKMGDLEGAYKDYLLTVRFNPKLVRRIPNEATRARVKAELERLHGGPKR